MIRGWALSNEMSVKLISQALNKALERRHHPQIHHSDRGGQYLADTYCQKLKTIGCRISMTDRAKPWQNPYIESTISRINDEYIIDSEYHDVHDAYQQLGYVLDVVYKEWLMGKVTHAANHLTVDEIDEKTKNCDQPFFHILMLLYKMQIGINICFLHVILKALRRISVAPDSWQCLRVTKCTSYTTFSVRSTNSVKSTFDPQNPRFLNPCVD